MQQSWLGRTGLAVSDLALGTMTWGRDTDEITARELLTEFLNAGGTLIDTSGAYAGGEAETILARLLHELDAHDEVTVITKAGFRSGPDGPVIDNSRSTVLRNLAGSVERLGRVDIALVASPDQVTESDEVAATLEHVLRSGAASYVGLSNFPAWQTAQIATLLASRGSRLACVEVEYSLLQRGIERELLPAAHALGVGVIAWAGLGRGVLTGKYRRTVPPDSRAASAHLAGFVQPYLNEGSAAIVDALAVAAKGLGCQPLDVALAWQRTRGVTSTIVGPRTAAQLAQILAAAQTDLPETIQAALDEISAPAIGYPERRA